MEVSWDHVLVTQRKTIFLWFLVDFHGFSKVVLWFFIFFMLDSMVFQSSFREGVWQEVLIGDFTREVDGRKS